MRHYALDASALMAFFEDRRGADKVEDLFRKAGDAQCTLSMSVVNWGEVYYSVWGARGEAGANQRIQQISQLPIELVGVDLATAKQAATFKARFQLPYADCFAAALAHDRKAVLVTSDRDFETVKRNVKLLWVDSD